MDIGWPVGYDAQQPAWRGMRVNSLIRCEKMSTKWIVRAVLLAVVALASAPLDAATIYIANGDADTAWIVDTGAGTFSAFDTSAVGRGYPLAVINTVILGDRDDGGAVEYDLAGVPTGNTFTGGGNFTELLDGTTNGATANYGIECCGDGNNYVTTADLTWENQQSLFLLPEGYQGSGIAYDTATGTLWTTAFNDSLITNFSLAGAVLGSFSHDAGEDGCCLAYDQSDDTLWMAENRSNVLRQYSKAGTLLQSVTIDGWEPVNIYGGEIMIVGAAPAARPVPALPVFGMVLLAGFVLLTGSYLLARRRG
jgi:hypothetical protein